MIHSINMRNLVEALIRVHIFRFTTESTLEKNPTKGRSMRNLSFRTLVFKLRQPVQERSPINVKSVKMLSVAFQVFKPIRKSTVERNHTNMICHVRVIVRGHIYVIIREFLQEKIHTDLRTVGEM